MPNRTTQGNAMARPCSVKPSTAVLLGLMLLSLLSPGPLQAQDPPKPRILNFLGMPFVYVPPGAFLMGSPYGAPGAEPDERRHQVTLTRGFYLQATEVTVAQWTAFVEETGYTTLAEDGGGAWIWEESQWKKRGDYSWRNPGFEPTPQDPVTCISLEDARAFLKWLNRVDDRGYRLPTEAEWEYACRAGSTTDYCNGPMTSSKCARDPNLTQVGWYCYNSGDRTQPVAQKQPNAWGLYDMHGNVWEWCRDRYGDYPPGPVQNPKGPDLAAYRVFRGGSFNSSARSCRSANRYRLNPRYVYVGLGFRLVREP